MIVVCNMPLTVEAVYCCLTCSSLHSVLIHTDSYIFIIIIVTFCTVIMRSSSPS